MAKIGCICGNVIPDQSDSLSYKARFMPDQDYDAFLDVVDLPDSRHKRAILHDVFHELFQCPACARLIIFRNGEQQGIFFEPEDEVSGREILRSSYGAERKGYLIADFYNDQSEISWRTGIESGFRQGLTRDELRTLYAEKLAYLSELNMLKSAFLRIDGKMEHSLNEPDFL